MLALLFHLYIIATTIWKLGRAVECTGLENRQGCEPFESSNLSASAIFKKTPDLIKFWGFLLPKIYPYEYHTYTAKYLIDRYY